MDIGERTRDGVTVLDVSGEIDLYNAPEIKNSISKLIEAKKYTVIVNLENVSYIDSSGIGALIYGVSALKKYQGGLRLASVNATVRQVFKYTKLVTFFQIHETEEEALRAFQKE
jgi:anti-sigma B factor antagonist